MKNHFNSRSPVSVERFRPRLSWRVRRLLRSAAEAGALLIVAAIFAIMFAYGWSTP